MCLGVRGGSAAKAVKRVETGREPGLRGLALSESLNAAPSDALHVGEADVLAACLLPHLQQRSVSLLLGLS